MTAMIVKIADNIISPLGFDTASNYTAVKQGLSQLKRHEGVFGLPEPFVASLFDRDSINLDGNYTFFEKICILSASKALAQADIDPASPRVCFVISTTKANVDLLQDQHGFDSQRVLPAIAAQQVSAYFGNKNEPIVVSNACTSGVCAQIVAKRLLDTGCYDYAVVIGADVQSHFIISGFNSFKALSPEPCKPFDKNRCGLNLGEAAATIVYARRDSIADNEWQAVTGAIRSDANHISGPSRTGEGSYRCLMPLLQHCDAEDIAFINTHGTATPYNDEMESFAIERAGLSDVPANSLKGYYGHTMGAAGVLETIISMCAVDDNTILPTRGFDNLGVTHPVNIVAQRGTTAKRAFIKMLSGFGGSNAAMLFRKGGKR